MPRGLSKWIKIKRFISFAGILILLAAAFAYAMFQGGFVSWFLFYSFLPFALYPILLFYYPVNFTAERTISPRTYNAGDDIEVNVTLTRRFPFPLLFLVVEDVIPGSLKQKEIKQMFFPGFKKKFKMTYTIGNASRGEHIFQNVRLKTGDALGLLEKEKRIPCKQAILVYPPHEAIFYRSIRNMFDQGGIVSPLSSHDPSLVAGIREYEPGDRFSWIDWKASARVNEMMTKEFDTRESDDFLIVLDTMPTETFEVLVKFAASAARTVIKNGEKAGILLGGKESLFIPPSSGADQLQAIFYHLAKVSEDGSQSVENLFEDPRFSGQSAVYMIVTSKLTKQMIDGAERLRGKKNRVIFFLIKGEGWSIEETELIAAAVRKGLIVQPVEHDFQMAFAGVKQA
ncbi:DUF58 domain-containing protein [Siminovitchia terrae]|uniref:DUF58 domain-containing protein n=1 Tax=Siminovitchia terrae TaxID=1914933 RepID=A0A429XAA2_SIMTE|nr:DUF58 domain-containing protein [Siminovitchia terrae]RST60354.1 DUF58 domain-containing protein [Siminovitchia terrae]